MKQLTQEQYQDLAILSDIFHWIEKVEFDIRNNGDVSDSDIKFMQKLRELHNDLAS